MTTEYTVNCTDWQDEGTYVTREEALEDNLKAELSYRLTTLVSPTARDEISLMTSERSEIPSFKLPEGDAEHDFARIIVVTIADKYGDSATTRLTVYVSFY